MVAKAIPLKVVTVGDLFVNRHRAEELQLDFM